MFNSSSIKEHLSLYWSSYLLGISSLYFLFSRGEYTFLDWIDLFIHEPGHFIFYIFGTFIGFLGGTLMQIIIPSMCAIFLFRWGNKILTQLSLFWLGHNFINISVYVDDANKMRLRLIGKVHDWNWILGKLELVEYAEEIGWIVFGFAVLIFILMLFVPKYVRDTNLD